MSSVQTELKGFTPVIDVVASDVGLVGAVVYGLVWRHCKMIDGVCKKTAEHLAELVNLDERTVRKHLKDLCEGGYIEDLTPGLQGAPHIYKTTNKVTVVGEIKAGLSDQTSESNSGLPPESNSEPKKSGFKTRRPRILNPTPPEFKPELTAETSGLKSDKETWGDNGNKRGELPPPEKHKAEEAIGEALAVYEKYHGKIHPNDLAHREFILQLVNDETSRFDMGRWKDLCRKIAAKKLKGRVDLIIQDYKAHTVSGPAALKDDSKMSAYRELMAESKAAEAAQAAIDFNGATGVGVDVDKQLGLVIRRMRAS